MKISPSTLYTAMNWNVNVLLDKLLLGLPALPTDSPPRGGVHQGLLHKPLHDSVLHTQDGRRLTNIENLHLHAVVACPESQPLQTEVLANPPAGLFLDQLKELRPYVCAAPLSPQCDVRRSNSLQPPPYRSCSGRLRRGPSRRSAARVATTGAGVAAFAALRRRDRHAASCRPLGLTTWSHRKETQNLVDPGGGGVWESKRGTLRVKRTEEERG